VCGSTEAIIRVDVGGGRIIEKKTVYYAVFVI
jgi:hypothetical protein